MPYVTQASRDALDKLLRSKGLEAGDYISEPGELSYVVARLIDGMLRNRERFTLYAGIVGAMLLLLMELYARKVQVYERSKIEEHGDVFSPLYFPPTEQDGE